MLEALISWRHPVCRVANVPFGSLTLRKQGVSRFVSWTQTHSSTAEPRRSLEALANATASAGVVFPAPSTDARPLFLKLMTAVFLNSNRERRVGPVRL